MAITATIDDSTVISATVNATSPIEGSLSQGNQPTVTRVTVPGPQGPSGASANNVSQAADVDASALNDGAILQYRSADSKWVARNEIETLTGSLAFNGGNF